MVRTQNEGVQNGEGENNLHEEELWVYPKELLDWSSRVDTWNFNFYHGERVVGMMEHIAEGFIGVWIEVFQGIGQVLSNIINSTPSDLIVVGSMLGIASIILIVGIVAIWSMMYL